MYKLIKNSITNQVDMVLRLSDNAGIPFGLENPDYQEYLAWLNAGNTPLPAEQ